MKVLLGVLLVIIVILQFNLWVGEGSYSQQLNLESQVEVQQEENVTLGERNDELENEVLDLKTGLDAVEERARSEFGMVKDGEVLYQIID